MKAPQNPYKSVLTSPKKTASCDPFGDPGLPSSLPPLAELRAEIARAREALEALEPKVRWGG